MLWDFDDGCAGSTCRYHCHLPAVVIELDDVVLVAVFLCGHDGGEERIGKLLPIHHHATLEEPMAAVLTASHTITHASLFSNQGKTHINCLNGSTNCQLFKSYGLDLEHICHNCSINQVFDA